MCSLNPGQNLSPDWPAIDSEAGGGGKRLRLLSKRRSQERSFVR